MKSNRHHTIKQQRIISDEEHQERIEAILNAVDILESKEEKVHPPSKMVAATKVILAGVWDRWMRKS